MPRIDPLQLLKCLSVLLSQEGGILSRDEVPRLVNLMTKFSKKLVSKCVYVLILKSTETSLVDMFMAEGGWTLIQNWLQDAVQTGNWDLVKEILGLLLITPVDVERLKMNCLPKLIKNLSRREDLDGVAQLSNQIVQNWLIIVKGSAHNATSTPPPVQAQIEKPKPNELQDESKEIERTKSEITNNAESQAKNEVEEDIKSAGNIQSINTSSFYKSNANNNKQPINKSSAEDDKPITDVSNVEGEQKNEDDKNDGMNEKDGKTKEKDKEKSTKSSSSSRSKSSSGSSKDKDREKDKKRSHSRSSSSKSKSGSSSSSSTSSKDKDRDKKDKDRDRKDKDRSRNNASKSSSSSKSSSKDKDSKEKSKSTDSKDKDPKDVKAKEETKEKQAEKDKDTLQKLKPQTLDKLGRIPKKSSSTSSDEKQKENKTENKPKETSEKDVAKKPSFSILNRKATGEERTKTVKVFNSKMRSTGLEEEVKPPPPRSSKKPTPSVQLPTIPPKRPSPPREPSTVPPEKKIKIDKIDIPERPGAIKLIPPKPKPPVLQESDMFMDALTASAPKKEAKKRKRRPSITKDTPSSPSSSPTSGDAPTPTSPTNTSPLGFKSIAPINFYQDTLSGGSEINEESKDEDKNEKTAVESEMRTNSSDNNDTPASPTGSNEAEQPVENDTEPSPPKITRTDGLKGVLLYTKKKGPKRSIKWKCEEDLVEIRYFELDETERVNVTRTFMDLAKMDITSEREALIMSRKTASEDLMEPQTLWRTPFVCERPEPLALPGSKSLEKDIQFAREKSVLAALYFDKRRIPDSPEEPIPENHQMSDPVIIPLEDPESQEIDLRSTPWPEPKGSPPQIESQPMPPMFPNMPFNPNFNNMANMPSGPPFVGVPPRFPGPNGPMGPLGPAPGPYGPPNMMHNNMMGPPMNQEIMNQGPINPGMYGPVPDGFIGPGNEPNFPIQQFNGPQVANMNMFGQNNFNHRGGNDGETRGGYRRGSGNNGGWVRMNGPRNNWKRGRGGGSRGGRLCKNIQNHGYCRNGDNCPFVH